MWAAQSVQQSRGGNPTLRIGAVSRHTLAKRRELPGGALVRPSTPAKNAIGFVFKNKGGAFTSGATEPNWPTTLTTVTDGAGTWTALTSPIDQPDGDDGVMAYDNSTPANRTLDPAGANPNNTGASQYAEVTYFLRHGNLYRRVLLIRNPYDNGTTGSSQPYDTDTPAALDPPGSLSALSGELWLGELLDRLRLFRPDPTDDRSIAGNRRPVSGAWHRQKTRWTISISRRLCRLARPDNRFGFDQTYNTTTAGPLHQRSTPGVRAPICKHVAHVCNWKRAWHNVFLWPLHTRRDLESELPVSRQPAGRRRNADVPDGAAASLLAIDSASYTMWILDANPPTNPLSLQGGPRRGEDILLTNVVSFDVKLWDPHYSEVPTGVAASTSIAMVSSMLGRAALPTSATRPPSAIFSNRRTHFLSLGRGSTVRTP